MAKVELKAPIVQEIADAVNGAQAAVLVQYLGLTVEQIRLFVRNFVKPA
jgi:large subunit ribosomal protein L10